MAALTPGTVSCFCLAELLSFDTIQELPVLWKFSISHQLPEREAAAGVLCIHLCLAQPQQGRLCSSECPCGVAGLIFALVL